VPSDCSTTCNLCPDISKSPLFNLFLENFPSFKSFILLSTNSLYFFIRSLDCLEISVDLGSEVSVVLGDSSEDLEI
jgi:hypothetical protein